MAFSLSHCSKIQTILQTVIDLHYRLYIGSLYNYVTLQ